ncbi:guanine nucleotide exchange factor [Ophiocordyceps sinensis CO18]|uniref:Guanine nucleotide exchange factor n=1 Tax=Ophiocordyceps sinensis (strain Co18 / CGMCC 3.14243) TaxID=911162 RepID=T5A7Z0_OPHSC|nr:guanine nucleotide exchange factor [Ophiocordyceps sinensis CO18]
MSAPVRLRVYNAFKGWLESHWRDQTDRPALKLIISFAEDRLGAVLPTAGPRLLELAKRVSGHGLLVPRLVSSMGKTNTAIGQESPVVLRSDSLRRARKSVLSELSLLVKTAKRLQECQKGTLEPREEVNDIIDEMILKAFKIIIKAVRFLDILDEDVKARASAAVTVMATVAEPPTPPAEQATFDADGGNGAPKLGGMVSAPNAAATPWGKRLTSLNAPVPHEAVEV